jgi:hypothetical protein
MYHKGTRAFARIISGKGGRDSAFPWHTYTYDEIASVLKDAGFVNIRILREGEQMDAVVEAFKPPAD